MWYPYHQNHDWTHLVILCPFYPPGYKTCASAKCPIRHFASVHQWSLDAWLCLIQEQHLALEVQRPLKKSVFDSPKTIFLVGNFNHPKIGDFQGLIFVQVAITGMDTDSTISCLSER